MKPKTYSLAFSGELLRRGFWLYVWEIKTSEQAYLYYVGRTGDSSSATAQSPFNRMGQHLGFNDKNNVLRRRLRSIGIEPENCKYRFVAHGPIFGETSDRDEHRKLRDVVAGLEKALADAMCAAGFPVLNTVKCRMPLNENLFEAIRAVFAREFPNLEKE